MLSLTLLVSLAAAEKPTLAVLYFDNNSQQPELEVMRKGLADLMVTDLVEWGGVTVVERDKLEAVLGELRLQRTRAFDQSTAVPEAAARDACQAAKLGVEQARGECARLSQPVQDH